MRTPALALVLALVLAGDARAGLRAGAAEGDLDAPLGVPLAGYTSRAELFGFVRPDGRAAPFARLFAPSTAVHTRPAVKAVALSSGAETLVLVKVDLIFSDADLLRVVEDRVSRPAEDLHGRIVLSTSHTHNGPGCFTQHTALMAGADSYDEAIFRRYAASIAGVVDAALAAREPARIGVAIDPAFDPLGTDAIFRDRRPANDVLAPDGTFLFEGDGTTVDLDAPGARGPAKDPRLALVRVDAAGGRPLAVILHYGIHGTALGDEAFALDDEHPDEVQLWSSGEAASAVEWKLEESFRRPVVVMHLQGAAGDVSPAGDDLGHTGFARLELLGERARDRALRLWRRTATASGGIRLRLATRAVRQDFAAVHVDRGGRVDWRYGARPAGVYDGDLLTFEDWTHANGAGLCGGRAFSLGAGGVIELEPDERAQVDRNPASASFGRGLAYGSCLAVGEGLFGIFSQILDPSFDLARDVPIPESLATLVSAVALEGAPLRVGPEPARRARVLVAAAPGEPTTYWSERLRGRARGELGFDEVLVVGYAQDHEGYLLLPEDWLSGGATEVQINLWGPLQGEYLLERLLSTAALLSTPGPLDPDPGPPDPPPGAWEPEPVEPAATPLAGTPLEQPPPEVERLHTASFEWVGGDPAADRPRVFLQRRARGGRWHDVRLASRRAFDDRTHRIVLVYRPEPIDAPPGAIERHRWRAYLQIVEDLPSLAHAAGFRTGDYRFRVSGLAFDGSGIAAYETVSDPFRIVPSDDFELRDLAAGPRTLSGRVVWPAPRGFRLLSVDARGDDVVPVAGARVRVAGGGVAHTGRDGRFEVARGRRVLELSIVDRFGNRASFAPPDASRPRR